jgi:pimeloyl-ACP methyl ester carboxylesterase
MSGFNRTPRCGQSGSENGEDDHDSSDSEQDYSAPQSPCLTRTGIFDSLPQAIQPTHVGPFGPGPPADTAVQIDRATRANQLRAANRASQLRAADRATRLTQQRAADRATRLTRFRAAVRARVHPRGLPDLASLTRTRFLATGMPSLTTEATQRPSPDRECPICLETLSDSTDSEVVRVTQCGHFFHRDCIMPWFDNAKTSSGETRFLPPVVDE